MADIVALLNEYAGSRSDGFAKLAVDAAAEIEKLRAEKLELANHIDGCVRVAADALKRAEIAEAVCRLTRPAVGHAQVSGGDNG